MGEFIIIAFITVAGILLTLLKFVSIRFVLRYAAMIDLITTVFLMWFLKDSVTGVVTALFAGFIMALGLMMARMVADRRGYEYKSYSILNNIKNSRFFSRTRE